MRVRPWTQKTLLVVVVLLVFLLRALLRLRLVLIILEEEGGRSRWSLLYGGRARVIRLCLWSAKTASSVLVVYMYPGNWGLHVPRVFQLDRSVQIFGPVRPGNWGLHVPRVFLLDRSGVPIFGLVALVSSLPVLVLLLRGFGEGAGGGGRHRARSLDEDLRVGGV